MQIENIPKKEHANVMSSFWSMLRELDAQADNKNCNLLKHQVAAWYVQWNRITGSNNEPSWVTREARISKEKENQLRTSNAPTY